MVKKILLSFIILSMVLMVKAQKVYFIYLQSENGTPFFVKMGDKVFSSTATGYLILSKLTDSTYTFSIGRTGKETAETRFSININKRDRGFLLKDVENGLGLFDLQTLTMQRPTVTSAGTSGNTVKKSDVFSKLLSQAADDSSLLLVSVAMNEDKEKSAAPKQEKAESRQLVKEDVVVKKETESPILQNTEQKKEDSIIAYSDPLKKVTDEPLKTTPSFQGVTNSASGDTVSTAAEKVEAVPLKKEEPQPLASVIGEPVDYKKSKVTRRSESSTTEGFGLVFLDSYNGVTDTIRILVPNSKNAVSQQEAAEKIEEVNKPKLATSPQTTEPDKSVSPIAQKRVVLDCYSLAKESDFLKLRKNMAAANNDDKMLTVAKKTFRNICFTTEQIRNLSMLFLTPEGKYRLFDEAYPHTSDPEQFTQLQSEIKDEYYSKRFKALISK